MNDRLLKFKFGKNWQRYLRLVDENRIEVALKSIQDMFDIKSLIGKKFLDVGSGSGLFSLTARKLGADVVSFDIDTESIQCTNFLKKTYYPHDSCWKVVRGSVLDKRFLNRLGKFDFVYSFGVLHHTGNMYQAFENIIKLVKPNGKIFVAIYNDQGRRSRYWKQIKKMYNTSILYRIPILIFYFSYFFLGGLIRDLMQLKNPINRYRIYKQNRGMSQIYDWIDWLGGYPFEVAKPEELFNFFKGKGFRLEKLFTAGGGLGNNQFVFIKV